MLSLPQLARALLVAVFLLGCTPALAIVIDEPVATATPPWAQDPPQPPQLSDEEQAALDAKRAGKNLTEAQEKAATRAEEKEKTAEKYQGKRNQQKRDNNRRRGRRRR